MNYEVIPLEGIGEIRFGMSFQIVRALVGGYKTFMRDSSSVFPCDYFSKSGIFAYYDADGVLEAVELVDPAIPIFDGVNLFGMSFESVMDFLMSKDPSVSREVDGAISFALGISVYAPQAVKNSSISCESVVVFKAGYYD
jgi:hypothetical protein